MSTLRLNPLAGRWVTMSADRAARPQAFDERHLPVEQDPVEPCPFCPGTEDVEPLAVYDEEGVGRWQVRVVPNRYPVFSGSVDRSMVVTNHGPVFSEARANGCHEILVFTPQHEASWADLDDDQVELAMTAVRGRIEAHAGSRGGIRYTQVIVNHGREAGASMAHPHGQVVGIPFVPKDLADEEAAFLRFAGGCIMCTTLEAEVEAGHRIVLEDDLTVAVCPYWSGTPYELLLIPRAHEGHLDAAKPADAAAVGRALRSLLGRLRETLGDVAYNVVFHTAPHGHESLYHWHVHVLPKLTTRAGFELGTGVLVNIVQPERAAAELNGA